jgi:hypothetical protein
MPSGHDPMVRSGFPSRQTRRVRAEILLEFNKKTTISVRPLPDPSGRISLCRTLRSAVYSQIWTLRRRQP